MAASGVPETRLFQGDTFFTEVAMGWDQMEQQPGRAGNGCRVTAAPELTSVVWRELLVVCLLKVLSARRSCFQWQWLVGDQKSVSPALWASVPCLDSPLQYKDYSCMGFCRLLVLRGRDVVLLCVSLCCTASSGVSAHVRAGCCLLAHILTTPRGAGNHWVLIPSLAAWWVAYSECVRDRTSMSHIWKPHPRSA